MSTTDVFLTAGEAGREFDPPISAARVRQLVDSGTLPALRTVGGLRLIARSEVLRLVAERRERQSTHAMPAVETPPR